jgi:hypothetical protein
MPSAHCCDLCFLRGLVTYMCRKYPGARNLYSISFLQIDMGNNLSLVVDALHPIPAAERLAAFNKLLHDDINVSAKRPRISQIMNLTVLCSFSRSFERVPRIQSSVASPRRSQRPRKRRSPLQPLLENSSRLGRKVRRSSSPHLITKQSSAPFTRRLHFMTRLYNCRTVMILTLFV